MSYGIVICTICRREVHQNPNSREWYHCEDQTSRCVGANCIAPDEPSDIAGRWCGRDAGPARQTFQAHFFPEDAVKLEGRRLYANGRIVYDEQTPTSAADFARFREKAANDQEMPCKCGSGMRYKRCCGKP
jgi:hypothetical protein